MSDERRPQSERESDERFQQALDEMFGLDSNNPDPAAEPAPEIEAVAGPRPVSSRPVAPPASGPAPYSVPATTKRSRRRTAALGCAGLFGLIFVCLVALLVIGLMTDDDGDAAAVSEPTPIVVTNVRPSYTASPGGDMAAGLVPVGTYVELSQGWRVAVIGTTPDATEVVLAENQFNEPPEGGRQFFMAMVSGREYQRRTSVFPRWLPVQGGQWVWP